MTETMQYEAQRTKPGERKEWHVSGLQGTFGPSVWCVLGLGKGRDTEETMDGKVLIVLIGPRGAFYIVVNNSSNKESNLMNGDGALVHVPSF